MDVPVNVCGNASTAGG
ncbi:hypothetical protein [Streptomyces sp. NBC_00328]|nr:hypothetical protein [Streptomyces sp. NBC_00328]